MIGLLDTVSLRRDLPDLGVSAGQRGTVVHVHVQLGVHSLVWETRTNMPAKIDEIFMRYTNVSIVTPQRRVADMTIHTFIVK